MCVCNCTFCSQSCSMCKEKRPAHSLCTRCNKWLCSSCTEEHRHGKEPGEHFLPVSLKGCTGTGATWGFSFFSSQLFSHKRSSSRLCATDTRLWHRHSEGYPRVNKRLYDFSLTSGPLPHSTFHCVGRKFGYLCFTDRIFFMCLSNLWSDGTGLGGLQQWQALPFQSFCPSLGNFIEGNHDKEFLCIWTRCVRESQTAKGCDHYRMFLS